MIQIINNEDIPINVRVIHRGDIYSRDQLIYQSDEPLVEFYDARFTKDHCFRGQFINRFMLSTLQDHLDEWPIETGIGLDGHTEHWRITGRNLMKAVEYALSTMKPCTDELYEELKMTMLENRKMRRRLVKALKRIDELESELEPLVEFYNARMSE